MYNTQIKNESVYTEISKWRLFKSLQAIMCRQVAHLRVFPPFLAFNLYSNCCIRP